jgi:hypothetical protein
MTRCQICGRRKHLRKDGGIAHHHVKGDACPGIGFPPIEQSDERLASYAVEVDAAKSDAAHELAELYIRRANYIPPELTKRYSRLVSESLRLGMRLARHRAWPERFRRQMETQGWGDPPPAYLIERTEDDR